MLDRPQGGEKGLLVYIEDQYSKRAAHGAGRTAYGLEEFSELASSAGIAAAADPLLVKLNRPSPKYFIHQGKVEILKNLVLDSGASLVVFSHDLYPSQERNLEQALQCRVIGRTTLILDIFAQRARTFEGQLQVELAQLKHLSTRLVRGWTHLERQKGGIGLRGPGETQLESDRRLIKNRIKHLEASLDKLKQQRDNGRRARKKAVLPTIALVGYTNAGKSTLFNALSGAAVVVADQLFATLDPTFRQLLIPQIGKTILIDTVGFVSDLPHDLIEAFSATLQETREADLLLQVVDLSHESWRYQMAQVEEVLGQLGALEIPRIEVYNKIDCIEGQHPHIERNAEHQIHRIWISAQKADGLNLLIASVQERLGDGILRTLTLDLPFSEAALRSLLYDWQAVITETPLEDGRVRLEVGLPKIKWMQLRHRCPAVVNYLRQNMDNNTGSATDNATDNTGNDFYGFL